MHAFAPVVPLSDHGYHLGDHRGLWRKDTLFEEALRVPLIVAAPGIGFPGVATGELAELTDVYPTLVELAGLPEPPGLDGVSLVPLLHDPQSPVRRAAVSLRERRAPDLGVSVRSGGWRYTEWPDGSRELYDLRSGGDATRDLARDPARAPELARMARVLDRAISPAWSAAAGVKSAAVAVDEREEELARAGRDAVSPGSWGSVARDGVFARRASADG